MRTRRIAGMVLLVLALALPAAAQAPWPRNPTPERVTFFAEAGGLVPVGRFSDAADGGFAPIAGGLYRLNEIVAPVVQFQWGFLDAKRQSTFGGGGSIDALNLLGGVRLYLPVKGVVHPWATALAGWAHYASHSHPPPQPAFGVARNSRDDPAFSVGGGLDFQLHPNFSLGIDARALFSISTDTDRGARDLTAVSIAGAALFHF